MRKVGIYFRGRTVRHVKTWGKDLWIAVRVKDSHELIKVLRDKGFFGRDVEGYLIVPEDVLKEVLGEDLFNKLIGGEGGGVRSTGPQRDTRDVSERGVSQ